MNKKPAPQRTLRKIARVPSLCLGIVAFAACDGVDVGRNPEPEGPVRIEKILLIDVNRALMTNLIDKTPATPCSYVDSCPGGASCVIPEGMTSGTCPAPFSPRETPPPVGDPARTVLRVVVNKGLQPEMNDIAQETPAMRLLKDPTTVQLLDSSNTEVAARKYYDAGGDPNVSADPSGIFGVPFGLPLGPAIVLILDDPIAAGATYTVKIDPTKIKDRSGASPTADFNGPIPAGGAYTFTTEGLYSVGSTPDVTSAPTLVPNALISIVTNANIDEATLTSSTVKVFKIESPTVSTPVPVIAFLDRGADPTACADNLNPRQFDVARVNTSTVNPGLPVNWDAGDYKLVLEGVGGEGTTATLGEGPFGPGATLEFPFTVDGDPADPAEEPQAYDNFAFPAQCTP